MNTLQLFKEVKAIVGVRGMGCVAHNANAGSAYISPTGETTAIDDFSAEALLCAVVEQWLREQDDMCWVEIYTEDHGVKIFWRVEFGHQSQTPDKTGKGATKLEALIACAKLLKGDQ